MALKYNNTDINIAVYCGTSLTQINFDGTTVWSALQSCSISGNAEVGSTLTATVTPSSVQSSCSFQWYRATASGGAGTPISGATSRTYTLQAGDNNCYVYCVATLGSTVKSNYTEQVEYWLYKTTAISASASGNGEARVSKTFAKPIKKVKGSCNLGPYYDDGHGQGDFTMGSYHIGSPYGGEHSIDTTGSNEVFTSARVDGAYYGGAQYPVSVSFTLTSYYEKQ